MRILVVNAGSSRLRVRVLDDDDRLIAGRDLEGGLGTVDPGRFRATVRDLGEVDAVGHRVVHGGRDFTAATRLDDPALRALEALAELAPLHQPPALAAARATAAVWPRAPAVACFDTAFHANLPQAAATYAIPRHWREDWCARRYGFHGLSHAYAARRAATLDGRPETLRMVICHLGGGASLAAVHGGRSVDTTMGFTPLEGLVMATRSGSVDPGLLLWLQERHGLSARELSDALEHRSGLVALAGTADMRQVLRAAHDGQSAAILAVDVYVHRVRAGVAAMAAAMDGLDCLVFTGGVGENAPEIREAVVGSLGFLGLALDSDRNHSARGDAVIGAAKALTRTCVIAAREDLEIAGQVRRLLRASTHRLP